MTASHAVYTCCHRHLWFLPPPNYLAQFGYIHKVSRDCSIVMLIVVSEKFISGIFTVRPIGYFEGSSIPQNIWTNTLCPFPSQAFIPPKIYETIYYRIQWGTMNFPREFVRKLCWTYFDPDRTDSSCLPLLPGRWHSCWITSAQQVMLRVPCCADLHKLLLLFPIRFYSIYSIYKWLTCCTYSIRLPHELTEVKRKFTLLFVFWDIYFNYSLTPYLVECTPFVAGNPLYLYLYFMGLVMSRNLLSITARAISSHLHLRSHKYGHLCLASLSGTHPAAPFTRSTLDLDAYGYITSIS